MNNRSKILLKALGNAILGLFLINIVHFLIGYFKTDTSKNFSFSFKHGIFSINNMELGHRFSSGQGVRIMIFIFVISMGVSYWNDKKNKDKS